MKKINIISIIIPVCLTCFIFTMFANIEESGSAYDTLSPDIRGVLMEEMNLVQNAMRELIASISAGDWETTAKTGKKMADSFILKRQLDEKQMETIQQSLPEHLIQLDNNFHRQAERLSRAASERDQELVAFFFSRLANSCIDCHSRYASHRFIGFRAVPSTNHRFFTKYQRDHHGTADANGRMRTHDFETLVQRFEDPKREQWQNPELVIRRLGDLSGKTIADIGAGTGYFSFRLAKHAKKVIAVDIDQRFIDYIEDKNASLEHGLPIETRLATRDDPRLAVGEADIILIVNTYHHIENRPEYFTSLLKKMRTGSKLVIIDFKKEETPVGPPLETKLSEAIVAKELMDAGCESINIDKGSLPYQYIIEAQ